MMQIGWRWLISFYPYWPASRASFGESGPYIRKKPEISAAQTAIEMPSGQAFTLMPVQSHFHED
jgi:hypothetical protein